MRKKSFIFLISVLFIVIFSTAACKFNFKYLYASVVYGDRSPIDSQIIFSKDTGFYDEEFYLKIYAPTNEIYYTLDGSEPTKNSAKYESPILINDATQNENTYSMRQDFSAGFLAEDDKYKTPDYLIDKCTVLKAVYYNTAGEMSEVEERIYFVDFDSKTGYDNVNIISITSDPQNLFSDEAGIYVLGDTFEKYVEAGIDEEKDWAFWSANYRNGGRVWEREACINVFNKNKESVLSQKVGIRIQGGASRGLYPKSLNIYARDEYGDNRLRYDFWGTGYYPKRMTLSCGGNDYRGKLLDRVGSELTRECAFSTMNYEPYILFLNGEYWGFYYLTEKYDAQYIENYYGVHKDEVVIIKNNALENGTDADKMLYENMKAFVETADMSIEANYQYACELLDMDSFIDYFAVEVYIGRRGDWPSDNFALWRSRNISEKTYEDGKWRWMLFDVNSAGLSNSSIEHDTIAYVIKHSEMFRNLCNNPTFVTRFCDRLLEISETIFESECANEKVSEYEALMEEPIRNHHRRFFGDDSGSRFQDYVGRIRNFNNQRKEYIEQYIEINFGDIYEINH